MKAVCDAGPLIALSKLGQPGLLLKLYSDILIPREVYEEVVTQGLRVGAPDAQAVEFLVREQRIRVVDVAAPSPLPAMGPLPGSKRGGAKWRRLEPRTEGVCRVPDRRPVGEAVAVPWQVLVHDSVYSFTAFMARSLLAEGRRAASAWTAPGGP